RPDFATFPDPMAVQEYFGKDAANGYADWDSLPGDVTSRALEGMTPGTIYLFAVVSLDEAGAWEPRFTLSSNVLQFKPTLANLGPRITVTSDFFSRTQPTGGIDLDPAHFPNLELPPNQ